MTDVGNASLSEAFREKHGSASDVYVRACNLNSDALLQNSFSNQFRTCTVGILAEIKAPDFWKVVRQCDDFLQRLPGCVYVETFHLQSTPSQKT